jgi:uncharacterized RDD family membrane protein YckC
MSAQPPEPPSDQPATGATPPPPAPPPPADAPSYGAAPPAGAPAYSAAPSYGAPQAGGPYAGGPQPGGLLDRFLARLIDGILLAIVNFVLASLLVVGALMGEDAGAGMYTMGGSYAAAAVSAVIGVAIQMGYFVYMESSRGQTLGKMVMKLRTVGPGGGNPTVEEAARRNIFYAIGLLGLIPVLGWFSGIVSLVAVIMIAVTINGDPVSRQGWHDRFAGGTRVVKL